MSVLGNLGLGGSDTTVVGLSVTGEGDAGLDTLGLEVVHLHQLCGQLSVLDSLDRHIRTANRLG